jgi:predicted dehydrogenase
MTQVLRWGIVGTGGIAGDFAEALSDSRRCRIVNVAGSSPAKAREFAERRGLPAWSPGLAELLDDSAVDAVYIASPHPAHAAQAEACIAAGKHVLCEKPLTMDADSTARVIGRARERGVFLMEAFMYRIHPLLRELLTRLKDGVIGEIRHVRADFGFRVPRDPEHRLFKLALGGGSILDVGGYPVSFARLIAGLVVAQPFAEPVTLEASGYIGPTGADELATALLGFESGLTAAVTSAVHHEVGTTAVVFGEAGKIVLPDPWIPGGKRQGLTSELVVFRDGRDPETVRVRTERPTYALEAEYVAECLPKVEAMWPAMSHADTLGNMRVLDAWQAALAKRREPRPGERS